VFLLLIIVFLILNQKRSETKDEFLINLAVLDHVIDDYVQIVYQSKIDKLKLAHNLNPESKLNAIKSYENKVNILISETTVDIIKLLTKQTSKQLRKRFSDKSLALYISNKIRNI
jgi:hypothetical protein